MGMFDWVNYTATCDCGAALRDFQSKDGVCQMAKLEPHEVRRFYTICDKCKTWVEYEVNAEVEVKVNSLHVRRVKPEVTEWESI